MALEYIPLHPTFGVEIRGVDFSKPLSRDTADALVTAASKYGVLVLRKTGMTDEDHIQFTKHFGDLSDISAYVPPNSTKKQRLRFLELFDASNLDENDEILKEDTKRFQYNKVIRSRLKFATDNVCRVMLSGMLIRHSMNVELHTLYYMHILFLKVVGEILYLQMYAQHIKTLLKKRRIKLRV